MFEIGQLTRLPLGYVGESGTRTISIDMKAWLDEYPGALIMIQVIRPVDRYKYPAAYTKTGDVIHWTVDGSEVMYAGKGLAQIALYNPDTKQEYKSRVVGTIVAESLDGFNDIMMENTDPASKWVNQVLEAANVASSAQEKAEEVMNSIPRDYKTLSGTVSALTQETAKNTEAIDSLNKGGLVMKEDFIGQQVNEWLDEHPEATTTVQDHSLTVDKLVVGTLGYVTPQMFGAVGDGVADDTAALKATIAAHDTIRFPYGTYRITDNLDISNKTVIGEHGSEILCTSQTTAREHQICLSGSCHVEGMTFRQIHHGVALVELLGCKQTVLNRCTFIVDNVHTRAILDLYGANEDIIIRDCNFDCRTLDESGAQTTGGVWVREIGEGRTSRNILFEGCKFNHKGVDEALAVWSWYGVVETVTVRDCVFYDYDGASQSVYFVTLSGKDIVMDGCTIHRKQPSIKVAAVMKIGLDTSNNQAVQMDYSVGVKNTTFLLSLPTSGQYVFRGTGIVSNCYIEDSGGALLNINYDEIVHEDIGDYILFDGCIIRLHGFDAQRDIRAHNCDITFTAETLTRAWFTRNVELVNCDIHVTQNNAILFQYGMASNFTVVDNCRFHGSYSASAWTLFHNDGVTQSRIRLKNAELPGKGAYGLAATDGYIANCITQANWSTINNISVTGNIVAF